MADTVYYYRIWCNTENSWTYMWGTQEPAVCPNNSAHVIDTNLISIEDRIESNDVSINNIDDSVVFREQQTGFRDLTGHNLWVKGFLYTAQASQNTQFLEKYSDDLHLQGGKIWVGENAQIGDYIELSITDEDNLLGYGSGFEIVKFIETLYTYPNFKWECCTEDAKLMTAGFYTNLKYYSTGSSDVKISIAYRFRT